MSETILSTQPSRRQRLWRGLVDNPITVKELRGRMRGRRAFVVLTVYLVIMSLFLSLVYLAYASSASSPFGPEPQDAGKVVFATVLAIQSFMVVFVGPAFTAGAISGEKERQTYDLLRTTLLTARQFVTGKLVSALSYVLLLILAAVPLQSIAFLLGGVSIVELLLSQAILLVAAVTFAMWGLFCSTRMRSTLSATVMTFAGALFITIGTPVAALLGIAIAGPVLFGFNTVSWVGEMILSYVGLTLAATNLPATFILSEIILLEENTLFFFSTTFGPTTAWLFSPWPLFLLFYTLLAWLLYWLCVRRVRRIANQ